MNKVQLAAVLATANSETTLGYTVEELRRLVEEADASGPPGPPLTLEELKAEARKRIMRPGRTPTPKD